MCNKYNRRTKFITQKEVVYMNYYNEIEKEIIDIETYTIIKEYSINKKKIIGYYNIGKLLVEAQGGENHAKYGNQLIKEYSIKLTKKYGKGYSSTNLKYFRQFYLLIRNSHALRDQISWTHYRILLKLKNIDEMSIILKFQKIKICLIENLKRELKKEYYIQVDLYMNYINDKVKMIDDNDTVGIIIVRKDNEYIVKYYSNPNIFRTTYILDYD